jgi:hypothetical protein
MGRAWLAIRDAVRRRLASVLTAGGRGAPPIIGDVGGGAGAADHHGMKGRRQGSELGRRLGDA